MSMFLLILILLIPALPGCDTAPETVPIPSDAVFYLRADHLEQNWDQLKTRQFISQCMNWKLWREPAMQDLTRGLREMQAEFKRNTGLPLNETTFMMMFGRRVDICVVPAENGPAALLIADLGPKSTPMKKIARAVETLESNRLSRYEFMDHDITAVKTKHGQSSRGNDPLGEVAEILYHFNAHQLIMATHRDAMEKAILILENGDASFISTDAFLEAEKTLGAASIMAFVDTDNAAVLARTTAGNYGVPLPETRVHADWIAFGATVMDSGIAMASAMKPATAVEPDLLKKLYRDDDAIHAMAEWLPSNAIAGVAGGINLPALIDHQERVLSDVSGPDGTNMWSYIVRTLEDSTGLNLPGEIRSWGGNGAFFSLHSIRMAAFIPVPEFSIGFHVGNHDAADAFTLALKRRIIEEYGPAIGSTVDVELPGNVMYTYVPVPMIAGFQPGYTLTDDVLIFGTSASGVTDLLLARDGQQSRFFDAPAFQGLLTENTDNLVLCKALDPIRLAQAGRQILDSLSLFIVSADQDPAVYREILDSMTTVPGIGFQMQFAGDLVTYRGTIDMQ